VIAQEGVGRGEVMEAMDLPFVTVIVPMRNEKAYIGECLDSLIEQDYAPDRVQVLVVDGMSTDGSRDIVSRFAQEHASGSISLLNNPRRIPAAAMNIGIREARGDVIIRLDAHSFASNDFISQNVAYLSRTELACVGGTIQSSSRCFLGKAIALAMGSPFGVGNALFRYAQKEQYVDTVAFGAYRKAVFDEIGLFDEGLIYSEDNEFNYRLRKHGGKILLTPAIRSFYYTRESLGELWRQYYHYGFGRIPFMARSPDSIMLRHLVPFIFVSVLLASGVLGIFNPLSRWLFLLTLSSYLIALTFFAFKISAQHGWKYLLVLPAVFACLHLGYGLGTYAGIWNLATRPKQVLGNSCHG